jgi:hypothetical protein
MESNNNLVFIQWIEGFPKCRIHLNDGTESEILHSKEEAFLFIENAYSHDLLSHSEKKELWNEILYDEDMPIICETEKIVKNFKNCGKAKIFLIERFDSTSAKPYIEMNHEQEKLDIESIIENTEERKN